MAFSRTLLAINVTRAIKLTPTNFIINYDYAPAKTINKLQVIARPEQIASILNYSTPQNLAVP